MKSIFNLSNLYLLFALMLICCAMYAQTNGQTSSETRNVKGTVVTQGNELAPDITVIALDAKGAELARTTSNAKGEFEITITAASNIARLRAEGANVITVEQAILANTRADDLSIAVEYIVSPVHEDVVIRSSTLEPAVERRNDAIYRNTLFARDDQLLFTLNSGINAGQHEGGGKSLEVRRFGYNTDHGGVGGGLRIMVDNVLQNHSTQGHGQGYLGQLKSLTPELVEDVDIINGPFSAQYGDFSGLGTVHIHQRESLNDQLTVRALAGSFKTFRTFLAYSPTLKNAASFIAYEGSRTDGPFLSPLRYKRDNLTGNYTYNLNEKQAVGFRLNFGRNDFFSSGQIPLDEVANGRLDRYGAIDPFNGGRVRTGLLSAYYRKEFAEGKTFKLDGSISRSLFDLYSNFTFFLNDEANGDQIVQHDSRLQQSVNAQYLQPLKVFGQPSLLTVGSNFLASQINVGLSKTVERNPFEVVTHADARITNAAAYIQHGIYFLDSRVHLEAGLRYDYFRFNVEGFNTTRIAGGLDADFAGVRGAGRLQPKLALSYKPLVRFPATIYFNYGRGISSQDARGVVGGFLRESDEENPTPVSDAPNTATNNNPPIATTDFYQLGASYNSRRFSLVANLFFIDQSNQQVYIPDDGSIEFAGASRSYGGEAKASINLTRRISFNGGITQVGNAFFRDTFPRIYVDSAPHTVADASLTLTELRGFTASLRYRHTGNYRLDGEDASIRAAGLDVIDLSVNRQLKRWLDFNLSVDNLTNKRYFETQNYFESRLRPGNEIISRIHATPGYPLAVTAGLTFRLFNK